ncbi:D-arabinono-1,4-lactone oxidase-domain-containing protein [Umbelopsis sp. AD052]|nr:D-arabinono-1,4-lactone oxidase-domain-containing protein [Umbelopsis sp. AD052]
MENLAPELKTIAKENHQFRNWANTFGCSPELYFEPSTEEEVSEIVRLAVQNKKHIKVVGSGHSPSDLALTNDYMISIHKLNRVLAVNREEGIITVEAGMDLHTLHQVLKNNGMALSNLGSISDQSVAGIMATASHGTGTTFGSLPTMITDLTIVNGTGDILYCSPSSNADVFEAARCSLGCLGVITRMSLKVEPDFLLEAIQEPAKFDHVLQNWDTVINSAEHVRVWWYPHTDDCVVWRANRTTKPVTEDKPSWFKYTFVGFHVYQFALNIARYRQSMIPPLTRFFYDKVHSTPTRVVDESYKVFNFDCLFPQYVNEWAIPLEKAPEALKRIEKFIQSSDLKVHFPVEIRFVDADDVWLSPSYGRKTCYIGVIMYRPYGKAVPYKKYWRAYEDVMRSLDGRPHWAKVSRNDCMQSICTVYWHSNVAHSSLSSSLIGPRTNKV